MKKTTNLFSVLLLSIIMSSSLYAQEHFLPCGTSQENNKILESNPAVKAAYLKEEAELVAKDKIAFANGYKNESRAAAPVYTIPVVFHILHEGGAENISDAQIYDQMRVLNEDFRKTNADISEVISTFKPIAADCEIEFKLAQKKPNGDWTNGIDRIFTPLTNGAHNNAKFNSWGHNKYLNIWVVKSIKDGGVAGYSYFPGVTSNNYDGVMILHDYVGTIGTASQSRPSTLTHEVGHWLNLPHTWGSTNDPLVACGDDGVSDTPITKGHKSCRSATTPCTSGVIENYQNYMEYSGSSCRVMFTAGQKTRMRNALNSTAGGRNNLWTTANLAATGVSLPTTLAYADFKTNNADNVVCQGSSLTFTNTSWNGTPTSYSWTFQGGTPATSTSSSPTVTYNTAGNYNVTLTVSNSSGTATTTKTGIIKVFPSSATIKTTVYTEDFEGSDVPNSTWQVNNDNTGSSTWAQTNTAANLGSKCVRIVNANTNDGHVDELISPSFDMSKFTNYPYLTYKVAYAQKVSTNDDKLQVLVSTDCGKTWTARHTLSGAGLSSTNGALVSASFVPTKSQWKDVSVNLSSYTSYKNLYVMFRFTSGMGNNVYLDNINMGPTGIEETQLASNINLNIYPNPIGENSTGIISFELTENKKTNISIYDLYGREIYSVFSGNLNSGEHKFEINTNENLASGIYFIKMVMDGKNITKKIVVQ